MSITNWFNAAFDFTVLEEIRGKEETGGYTNDPNDRGGETKWGLSKRSFPALDIKNLTKDQAKIVYHNQFWKNKYDQLINKDLAIRIFDMAVNSGSDNAEKTLQMAINECGGTVETVKVDGEIGPLTVKAANMCHNGWLLERFRVERSKYYADCVQKNPANIKYLKGWIWRNYR